MWKRSSGISAQCEDLRHRSPHTCSASSLLSNSMNAYWSESPVLLSLITWQLIIGPKRENISSRSSSRVTGLSLHTNNTFSGGRTLANGRSPTISNVNADALAACFRRSASASSSGSVASGSSSSAIRVELSGGFVGIVSGTVRPSGSGNGSSVTRNALVKSALRIVDYGPYQVSQRDEYAHPSEAARLDRQIPH